MASNHYDQVIEEWDKKSSEWNSRSQDMWDNGSRKTILPFFQHHVSPEQGAVLDAGCADGYASMKLAQAGYTVTGVDISREMIEIAKKRSALLENLTFTTGNVSQLPFADESFAAIISINVVEFTESPLQTLREFYRLLKPGGMLVLGILGPTAAPRTYSYRRLYGESVIQNTMMPWETRQLTGENGYTLVESEPVYKDGVDPEMADTLSQELKEALSFLTVYGLKK